jgi:hypothetical protein
MEESLGSAPTDFVERSGRLALSGRSEVFKVATARVCAPGKGDVMSCRPGTVDPSRVPGCRDGSLEHATGGESADSPPGRGRAGGLGSEGMDQPLPDRWNDPLYRAAVTDLLGVLAYGELTASIRMATDADLAPALAVKAGMARLAANEFRQYEELLERMRGLGIDPEEAMQPFVAPFTAYHARTKPRNWLEGLVKAYVGEGIAKDFYREMASFVDQETQDVLDLALDEANEVEFIVPLVRQALHTDPHAAGRLNLWGRRLLGEALSQGQAVAVDREALSGLLIGSGADLAAVGQMFSRLTDSHRHRMTTLGLHA